MALRCKAQCEAARCDAWRVQSRERGGAVRCAATRRPGTYTYGCPDHQTSSSFSVPTNRPKRGRHVPRPSKRPAAPMMRSSASTEIRSSSTVSWYLTVHWGMINRVTQLVTLFLTTGEARMKRDWRDISCSSARSVVLNSRFVFNNQCPINIFSELESGGTVTQTALKVSTGKVRISKALK